MNPQEHQRSSQGPADTPMRSPPTLRMHQWIDVPSFVDVAACGSVGPGPRGLFCWAPFAAFQGQLTGQPADAIAVQVRPADFNFAAGGRVILGFALSAPSGSSLDPGATLVSSARPGGVRVLLQRADARGGTVSVTLASVRPG